jgi:hypothetical protein
MRFNFKSLQEVLSLQGAKGRSEGAHTARFNIPPFLSIDATLRQVGGNACFFDQNDVFGSIFAVFIDAKSRFTTSVLIHNPLLIGMMKSHEKNSTHCRGPRQS